MIHGVDAEIPDGEFIVIVGPSGCGKSTLLRMVAGLEEITGGEIAIGGRVVNELEPAERDIAMVFQNYALYPHMSVFDNMAYGLKIAKVPKAEIKARVDKAANILELAHLLARKPRELSGGQRQRVAMGRAIVRQPQVFLFDEPLSNLDAKLRAQTRLEIQKLHRELGITSLFVTHDQVEAMTLAQRMIVMNAGNMEQVGGTARTLDDADGRVPLEPGVARPQRHRGGRRLAHGPARGRRLGRAAPPGHAPTSTCSPTGTTTAPRCGRSTLTGPAAAAARAARSATGGAATTAYSADEYLELIDRFAQEGLPFSRRRARHGLAPGRHRPGARQRLDRLHAGTASCSPTRRRSWPSCTAAACASRSTSTPPTACARTRTPTRRWPSALGIDPASELPVAFDPTDPDFLDAYLEVLHHPLEDEGVDFWWLDWQQGEVTELPGLDPLWMLNHFHFLDSGARRPPAADVLALRRARQPPLPGRLLRRHRRSRWESLDFQPEFTATASNIGYGWWSHDIGGHFFGVQGRRARRRAGCSSACSRRSCGCTRPANPLPRQGAVALPGEAARRLIGEALRLRHRLRARTCTR